MNLLNVLSLLVATVISSNLAAKVVMLPKLFGHSHFLVLSRLGEELGRRGHEVTIFFGDNVKGGPVSGPFFKVFNTTLKRSEHDIASLTKGHSFVRGLLRMLSRHKRFCDSILSDEKMLNELQKAEILVGDSIFMCSALVAAKFDIPHVTVNQRSLKHPFLGLYGVSTYPSYVPQMFSGLTPNMGLLDRIKNFGFYLARSILLEVCAREIYGEVKRKHNIKPDEDIWTTLQRVDLVLLSRDPVIDSAMPMPPYVKDVGGSFMPSPAKPLQPEWEEFMSSSGNDGVILVSFGSVLDTLDKNILSKMNEAFSKLRMKVIWRINKENIQGAIGSNIKTVLWMPQNDILGHSKTKLFITHGGASGLAEAVYHGVPVICSPFFADQLDNARSIEYNGLGETLSVTTASVDQLVEMINKVLSDKRYKQNAVRQSKITKMRPRTPVEEAADLIEYLHDVGYLAHLKPKGLELPFYQLYMLDVLLVLGVVLTLVLLIVVALVKRVINVCCGVSKKTKTQ